VRHSDEGVQWARDKPLYLDYRDLQNTSLIICLFM
jgi:hypothetical protein